VRLLARVIVATVTSTLPLTTVATTAHLSPTEPPAHHIVVDRSVMSAHVVYHIPPHVVVSDAGPDHGRAGSEPSSITLARVTAAVRIVLSAPDHLILGLLPIHLILLPSHHLPLHHDPRRHLLPRDLVRNGPPLTLSLHLARRPKFLLSHPRLRP
jgi:hypothetical protein